MDDELFVDRLALLFDKLDVLLDVLILDGLLFDKLRVVLSMNLWLLVASSLTLSSALLS